MEERGKCKKRPDLQYYKPPILIHKPTIKEGEMPEVGKKAREAKSPNIRESIVITTHRQDGANVDKQQNFTKRIVYKQNLETRPRRIVKSDFDKDSKSPECNGNATTLDARGDEHQFYHRHNSSNYKSGKMFNATQHRKVSSNVTQSDQHDFSHHHHHQNNSQRTPEAPNMSDCALENNQYGTKLHEKDLRVKLNDARARQQHRDNRTNRRFHEATKVRTAEMHQDGTRLNRGVDFHASEGSEAKVTTNSKCNISSHFKEVQSSSRPNNYPYVSSVISPQSMSPQDQLLSQASSSPSSSPPVSQPREPLQSFAKTPHPQNSNVESYDFERREGRQTGTISREQFSENGRLRWNSHDDQQKSSQSSYSYDRKQSKKFQPRNDYKTYEQLPPRFQKFYREKMGHRNVHPFDGPNMSMVLTNDFYQPDQINRAQPLGQISSSSTSSTTLKQYHSDPLASPRDHKNHLDSHGEFLRHDQNRNHYNLTPPEQKQQNIPNSGTIVQPTNFLHRQLYDNSANAKPCVIIRPTSHNSYQTANNPHNRCPIAPGLMPGQLPGNVHGTNMHPQYSTDCLNNLAYINMKQWQRQLYQISNDKRIPLSPNVMLHYLPHYPSSPNNLSNQSDPGHINQPANMTGDQNTQSKRKIVESKRSEITQLEQELEKELLKYPAYDERVINPLRFKIQSRYQNIILTDPKYCTEHSIEALLWKSVYLQFIELRQKEIKENPDLQSSKDELLKLVEDASIFFENLLVMIQDDFNFSIDDYINHHYDTDNPKQELIKFAALSVQKMYIYLGDLARFREQISVKPNYNKARNFFIKAQQIAPNNGLPYNQLALLAVYGRRRLDAVCNYMRSLACNIPTSSARQSLLQIFEEVRVKYESVESIQMNGKVESPPINDEENVGFTDIGKNPDPGKPCSAEDLGPCKQPLDKELNLLDDIDLTKRFVLSFLNVHGKLFTKIGLESFNSIASRMLLELRCILKRYPIPMSSQRLLQLMTINMFSVYQASAKEVSVSSECRASVREKASHVIISMVSLFLERIEESLDQASSKGTSGGFIDNDVAELLPALKTWTDWMWCQTQTWSPTLTKSQFPTGREEDVWSLFARVLNKLNKLNLQFIKLQPSEFDGSEQITLPEDNLLSGFIPLFGASCPSSYIQFPYDKEQARTSLRINRIQFFGKFLSELPDGYIAYDVEQKIYISRAAAESNKSKAKLNTPNSKVKEAEVYCY